jgi:predicted esterase
VSELRDWSLHGAVGMAGNVREWCFNATDRGTRFVLGGACGDPIYLPLTLDSAHPLQRSELSGFRCVRLVDEHEFSAAAAAPVAATPWPPAPGHDELMDTETFDLVVRDRFSYDRAAPLEVAENSVDEGEWTHVTARINAAYRQANGVPARFDVHLFLPKHAAGPGGHQAVVYSPAGDARMLPRMRALPHEYGLDALVRSGRVVLWPVFLGTFERRTTAAQDAKGFEDERLCIGLDLMRAVDYLAQRGDIDMQRLGYYGFSFGAEWVGSLVALEPRFAAVVFEAAGLPPAPLRKERQFLELRHCLPQIHAPVLMLNGSDDPIYPVVESQQPMFELLGSSIKEHYVHPTGNHMLPPTVKFAHMLPWFDQHLGRP